ncbi:phage terminase large subunit [Alteriqipengyuania flavescens]|uniref:phage terminase large subunit n=1 Tax=Alteriqipengyuania flavescens TaxID=3053610 RepID=UPI0025B485A9|nr:phage terminase large subunit [Alteriqipengyuania flavescens]WJY17683.1 phage terminase large subunit [Alteriqipengyuania flavescens]WJY23626.1 phage terminase large subunit [Alteriqipengyuania flavescens]
MLQGSFLKFLWYVWLHVLSLPEPTRVQYDIARYLVGGPARRFIQAFRGVGKTFITAAYVVWRLWKNPDLKVAIVSANETLASEIAGFIKQIIDSAAGDDLWPELRARPGQRQSTLSFDVGAAKPDKSPSVKAMSIVGQLTGSRADLTISDDVEVPKNSETETMREKLAEKTKEYAAITKPGGEIVYLGTPQSEQSIYRGLPERGYEVRIWPARYPLKAKMANYAGAIAPMLLADMEADETLQNPSGSTLGGAPTDPARFDDLDLIEREADYKGAGFLLQFQLDTTLSDAERYPLKTRDLMVLELDRKVAPARLVWGSGPDQVIKDVENVGFDGDRLFRPMHIGGEFLPYQASAMHIDPSGRGRDRTTYAVTKFLAGYVFLTAWGGFKDGYGDDTLAALAQISADHKVDVIVPEDNFGDGMFGKLLETHVNRIRPAGIQGMRAHGMKEERIIRSLEPLMRQHRLVVDLEVLREDLRTQETTHRGLFQLTHMQAVRGALKHDDKVDVLAMAAAHWSDYLNADAIKAEGDRKAKAEAEWERRFFASQVMGSIGKPARGVRGRRGMGRRR